MRKEEIEEVGSWIQQITQKRKGGDKGMSLKTRGCPCQGRSSLRKEDKGLILSLTTVFSEETGDSLTFLSMS